MTPKEIKRLDTMAEVYRAHRDNLHHISQARGYNLVNRQVMASSVRKFLYEMDRAALGLPVASESEPVTDK